MKRIDQIRRYVKRHEFTLFRTSDRSDYTVVRSLDEFSELCKKLGRTVVRVAFKEAKLKGCNG